MSTFDDDQQQIVPAAAVFAAMVIWAGQPPLGERPTITDIYNQVYPVCAWRIHQEGNWAEPVLPEPVVYPSIVMTLLSSGQLLEVNGGIYDDLDDARMRVLGSAQRRWDEANASPPPAA